MKEELLMLRGSLAQAEQDKFRLAARIQGKVRSVKVTLAMTAARSLEEIDLRAAADELSEAADLRDELLKVQDRVAQIKADLGD